MLKQCEKPGSAKRRIPPAGNKKGKGSSPKFTITAEEAMREAERCLGLRSCGSCEICSLFCPDLCITRSESGEVQIDLTYCKGCGICAAVCPKQAIQMVIDKGD
jgi:2-oxoacid:acceptor oxidoreductase delta subunit (pyruvate/2-ketoisovalerate family)